jgi:hypothetical protein
VHERAASPVRLVFTKTLDVLRSDGTIGWQEGPAAMAPDGRPAAG